jgi:hypothetical protein
MTATLSKIFGKETSFLIMRGKRNGHQVFDDGSGRGRVILYCPETQHNYEHGITFLINLL